MNPEEQAEREEVSSEQEKAAARIKGEMDKSRWQIELQLKERNKVKLETQLQELAKQISRNRNAKTGDDRGKEIARTNRLKELEQQKEKMSHEHRTLSQRITNLRALLDEGKSAPSAASKSTRERLQAHDHISEEFYKKHIGDDKYARKMAEKRHGTITGENSMLLQSGAGQLNNEIRDREAKGHHSEQNKIENPETKNKQFLTERKYEIIQSRFDESGTQHSTNPFSAQIYYDVRDGKIHHLDGYKKA